MRQLFHFIEDNGADRHAGSPAIFHQISPQYGSFAKALRMFQTMRTSAVGFPARRPRTSRTANRSRDVHVSIHKTTTTAKVRRQRKQGFGVNSGSIPIPSAVAISYACNSAQSLDSTKSNGSSPERASAKRSGSCPSLSPSARKTGTQTIRSQ